MARGTIHQRGADFSDSSLREKVGDALTEICAADDNMTDAKLGRILGRCGDQARNYRRGEAEMTVSTFLRGVSEWGGTFANPVLGVVGYELRPVDVVRVSPDGDKVVKLAAILSGLAVFANGQPDDARLLALASEIDDGKILFDELSARLDAARGARLRSVA